MVLNDTIKYHIHNVTNMYQNNSVQIGVRLAPRTVEALDKRVKDGYARSRADAARQILDEVVVAEE